MTGYSMCLQGLSLCLYVWLYSVAVVAVSLSCLSRFIHTGLPCILKVCRANARAVSGFFRKVSYPDIAVLLTCRYMTIGLLGKSSTLPVALNFRTSFVMVLCLCKEKLKRLLINVMNLDQLSFFRTAFAKATYKSIKQILWTAPCLDYANCSCTFMDRNGLHFTKFVLCF